MRIVCIVQARVGSSRLPRKVLKHICEKTVLQHDIERLRRVNNIDEIVIATTIEKQDDAIVNEAIRLGVKCFRGSEDDVLSRYYYASKENNADVVIRVTSDCPLIDSEVTGKIIQCYIDNKEKYDYVSNTLDRTFPRGLDTEVFSFSSLEKAFKESTSSRDREHVTPYIWENPSLFKIYQYKNKKDYSQYRWTLDTPEDFELIEFIYNKLYNENKNFSMNDILRLYKDYNKLNHVNCHIEQKHI